MANSTDKAGTVLDYVDNITVPGKPFKKPGNEYWALTCLRDGMEFLYHQALRCDETVRQQANPSGNASYFGAGNLPELNRVPQGLLTCAFHWYAISACNYVRTVDAIARRQNATRPVSTDYVETVIPEVRAFRDKVAAHFSWSTKNKQDNEAERLASIIPPLTFHDDSFHVGALKSTVRRAGKVTDSQIIRPWSICKVHERLRQRYWPDQQDNQRSS